MHPIDQLGQPAAVLLVILATLSVVDRWARRRLALIAADDRARRSTAEWLEALWSDVDTLGR